MAAVADIAERLAALEAALAERDAMIDSLLQERATAGDPMDALQAAIADMERQYGAAVPGAKMRGPCVRIEPRTGQVCGHRWELHCAEQGRPATIRTHSYLEAELPPGPPPEAGAYARDDRDRRKYPAIPAELAEDVTPYTVAEAAERLSVTPAKVRAMLRARQLRGVEVMGVTLIERRYLDMMIARAELEQAEAGGHE